MSTQESTPLPASETLEDEKILVNLKGMKIADKVDYAERLIYNAENNANEEIRDHPITEDLRQVTAVTKAAQNRKATAGMGDAVADADAKRDNSYRSLKKLLDGIAGFSGEKSDAARALLPFFDKPINHLSYASENQVIDLLLSNLGTTKSKALIEIAGVGNEVDTLKEDQKTFKSVFAEKQSVTSDIDQQRSATSYDRELTAAIRAFLSYIWAMRKLPGWRDLYFDVLRDTKSSRRLAN